MRWMALLLAAVAVCSFCGLVPFACRDIAELAPAQILCIASENGTIRVCTDDEIAAVGTDLSEALAHLQQAAPGSLLLATVDCLVLVNSTPDWQTLIDGGLRPAAEVYRAPSLPSSVDQLAVYLRDRNCGCTLGVLCDEPTYPIPQLVSGENGLVLEAMP